MVPLKQITLNVNYLLQTRRPPSPAAVWRDRGATSLLPGLRKRDLRLVPCSRLHLHVSPGKERMTSVSL